MRVSAAKATPILGEGDSISISRGLSPSAGANQKSESSASLQQASSGGEDTRRTKARPERREDMGALDLEKPVEKTIAGGKD